MKKRNALTSYNDYFEEMPFLLKYVLSPPSSPTLACASLSQRVLLLLSRLVESWCIYYCLVSFFYLTCFCNQVPKKWLGGTCGHRTLKALMQRKCELANLSAGVQINTKERS